MAKRVLVPEDLPLPPAKRRKSGNHSVDRLSGLSDELLLRVLSSLSVADLNLCQRLSRKFYHIAADPQLWRAAYYERFVRPRVSRLPGSKTPGLSRHQLSLSSKLSKWLDEPSLVRRGREINWKNQYKLRHNWSRGACNVRKIPIEEDNLAPPLLVKLHDGIIYTVDSVAGLRAWSSKEDKSMLASLKLKDISPTSLATDSACEGGKRHTLVIGFQDGSFAIFSFWKDEPQFDVIYEHESSSNGMLVELAFYSSFLLTMTASHLLSIYKLSLAENRALAPPLLLHSLRSHTGCPPVAVSLRQATKTIIATVAYPIPPMVPGVWSVGLQEIHLRSDGEVLDGRTAVSVAGSSMTLGSSLSHSPLLSRPSSPTAFGSSNTISRPTSISYAHPYLLLSHTDNTLSVFLVTSNASVLSISKATRLWGHTSSVSGAHVEGKGKAVSVSKSGEELRIWELEGSVGRRRIFASVPVVPGHSDFQSERSDSEENPVAIRGSVGFDDENVVLLRERVVGPQELLVYDFR